MKRIDRRPSAWLLLAALLTTAAAAVGQEATTLYLERFQLEHRHPDHVRAAVAPLLSGPEQLGQVGAHLVVSARRSTLERLREVIGLHDVPVRSLSVTLTFPDDAEAGAETGAETGAERSEEQEPVEHRLLLAPGEQTRLTVPDGAGGEQQLDLRLEGINRYRQLELHYLLTENGSEPGTDIDPAGQAVDGQRQVLITGQTHGLSDGITIEVHPQP